MMDFKSIIPCECKERKFTVHNLGTTLLHWTPCYDENGKLLNRNPNRTDYQVKCTVCSKVYAVVERFGEFKLIAIWHDGDTSKKPEYVNNGCY